MILFFSFIFIFYFVLIVVLIHFSFIFNDKFKNDLPDPFYLTGYQLNNVTTVIKST